MKSKEKRGNHLECRNTIQPKTTTEDAQEQAAATEVPENLFEREELAQFDADDVNAGKAIGVMLSLFFLYTMFAMSIAGLWTYFAMSTK